MAFFDAKAKYVVVVVSNYGAYGEQQIEGKSDVFVDIAAAKFIIHEDGCADAASAAADNEGSAVEGVDSRDLEVVPFQINGA